MFEEQPSNEKINLTLAALCERTVDSGHCLRHNNSYYKMLDKKGMQVHYRKGTKTMFIQAFDGNKYCCVNDTDIYALACIPEMKQNRKIWIWIWIIKKKPEKQYIPPMNHPWRKSIFHKFVQKQEHHWNDNENATA